MKANRSLRQADDAVSNVMGGVLFFTVLFLFFVTVRVEFVPQWTEDDEAALATKVQGQVTQLKGEVDRQAGNRSISAVGNPVTLGERLGSRFFQSDGLPGSIAFEPAVANVSISAPELLVFEENGATSYATNETWIDLTGPLTLEDVSEVRHLRVRITDPESYDQGDAVNLTIYDADNEFAGSLVLYNEEFPSGYAINARVTSAEGDVIYDQGESSFQQHQPVRWWMDALASELHFSDVLAAAQGPVTLAFDEQGMDGAYTITYLQDAGGGSVIVGGAGRVISDYAREYGGGRLSIVLPAQHFVPQTIHLENGGVIVEQDDGHVMRIAPVFRAETLGGITKLTVTTPALIGGSDALSHRGTVNVFADGQGGAHLVGTAPRLTYAVHSAFPDAWADHFDTILSDAGLESGNGEYLVTVNGDQVVVTVYGKTTAPSSTDHDLAVDLTHARVHLDFEA